MTMMAYFFKAISRKSNIASNDMHLMLSRLYCRFNDQLGNSFHWCYIYYANDRRSEFYYLEYAGIQLCASDLKTIHTLSKWR